jgi:ParB family chromosome partitioning protein
MSTRSMGTVEANMRRSRATGEGKEIEFLDAEGFSAVYREGVWTLQRFMTKATLEKTLSRYFGEVKVLAGKMETDYLRAVCQKPLPLDLEDARESLGIEFNMEYPGGYHHGKHAELVELLLRLTAEREARTS